MVPVLACFAFALLYLGSLEESRSISWTLSGQMLKQDLTTVRGESSYENFMGGYYIYGLAWDGENLWAADAYLDTIFKLDENGKQIPIDGAETSFPSPGIYARGLAWDGTYLWHADKAGKIYKLDTSGNVISSFDSPGPEPTGLTWDGTYLWCSDADTGLVYKLDTDGNVLYTFRGPGGLAWGGLAWDGTYLWCGMRKYDTDGNLISAPFRASDWSASDLAWDGIHLWVADPYEKQIYRVSIFTLTFRKPDGNPLANTEIWYLPKAYETCYFGVTDLQGRILTFENFGNQTMCFVNGKSEGKASIGPSGEAVIVLTKIIGFPIMEVVVAVLIAAALSGIAVHRRRYNTLAVIGAIIVIAGVFLPWVHGRAFPPAEDATFLGMNCVVDTGAMFGIGVILTLVFALASLVAMMKKKYYLSTATGPLTLVFSIMAIVGVYDFRTGVSGTAFRGSTMLYLDVLYGGFVCLVGAMIFLVGTAMAIKGK